jgi:hypothetical protein
MSDWKNPNFRNDDWQRWAVPQTSETKEKVDASLAIRGILGFLLIVGVNAFAIFAFLNVLGFSVAYRDSTIAAVIFVMWRVYDISLFRKIRNKD